MAAPHLEVWAPGTREVVPLETPLLSIGKAASNDLSLGSDPAVSQMHAVLQRYAGGWSVRDLTSHNGTFINGYRVLGECRLRDGDEIRVGRTKLLFRGGESGAVESTAPLAEAPSLTPRERDVLRALCRPVFSADMFTEPASIPAMANELCVTEAAIKQHLGNLYDKFGIYPQPGSNRRVELANAAINRGAITLAELRGKPPDHHVERDR